MVTNIGILKIKIDRFIYWTNIVENKHSLYTLYMKVIVARDQIFF